MRAKLMFVAGAAVGYVVGSRQGRQAYETVKRRARELWGNPTVQKTVSEAQDVMKEAAPVVGEKIRTAAGSAKAKVSSATKRSPGGAGGTAESTAPSTIVSGTSPSGPTPGSATGSTSAGA